MSLMKEYIKKRLSVPELEKELLKLILNYNKIRKTYLLVYATAIGKGVPRAQIEQEDYYLICDLLASKKGTKNVDIYIETPGGLGETAEEIVRFLHRNFGSVSYVVSGEAKSAGTIIVLSGNEILMTNTGSLGPIDAQMKIGRSVTSAYDYMEWVKNKREEAEIKGTLNPFDATMVAQITPGEFGRVFHALKFAEDLVLEWLVKYKFKNWNVTETNKKHVTDKMKEEKAKEIAKKLMDHSRWRSHGRSIKIDDLEGIGLRIERVDDNKKLADIVYRIQTVCRFIFDNTAAYKLFATEDNKIFKQAVPVGAPIRIPKIKGPNAATFEQKCPKCGEVHRIYAKLSHDPKIDEDHKRRGFTPFPKDAKIICKCGFVIDLLGHKNEIEMLTGKKVIVG